MKGWCLLLIKLFTDIDLDGLGCGLIAKLAFNDKVEVAYCSYRILNQRVEAFIENPEHAGDEVYITDLAVNEAVEKKLDKRFHEGKHIRMIDHHVTALHFNQYKWGQVKTEYENGKKTCATSLFYEYLKEQKMIKESKALEEFIDLVRQYDTWEWQENKNVNSKRLNDLFYILSREKFEEEMLSRLKKNQDSFSLSESENMLLDIEEMKIERYIHSKNRQMIQTFVGEYCIGIVHAEQYLSELGNALNQINPHLDMIALVGVGNKKMGFRTIHDSVNVAEFARHYGGGGHPKASGSELTPEAFETFVVNVFAIPAMKVDPDRNEFNLKGAVYGTLYQNAKGEISFIQPVSNDQYAVSHKGEVLQERFPSFEEAERYIKRHYSSWLRFDQECLKEMASSQSISIEEVKSTYEVIVKQMYYFSND